MECRAKCGACCIAPSISSAMPEMPAGKPANLACPHLDSDYRCRIFHDPARPAVCGQLQPNAEMCGDNRQQALCFLAKLEKETAP
ncbi:YkgJ family cysteine cluster protein [Utexia brackfieldae]|uniref:YkgJ family cysteine cluster protein n=1 Tax=Utexia brackfieldae TaxID=3074108 RepID=UPI00370D3F0C